MDIQNDISLKFLNSDDYAWSIYNFILFKEEQWKDDVIDMKKMMKFDSTKLKTMTFANATKEFGYKNETRWKKDL